MIVVIREYKGGLVALFPTMPHNVDHDRIMSFTSKDGIDSFLVSEIDNTKYVSKERSGEKIALWESVVDKFVGTPLTLHKEIPANADSIRKKIIDWT